MGTSKAMLITAYLREQFPEQDSAGTTSLLAAYTFESHHLIESSHRAWRHGRSAVVVGFTRSTQKQECSTAGTERETDSSRSWPARG